MLTTLQDQPLSTTRYSLHYLMFGGWPHLPINYYFPMIRGTVQRNTSGLTTTLASYVNSCGKPLKRFMCSPFQRQRDRSNTLIGKLMPFHWNQMTWSWLKPMPTRGGGGKGLVGGGAIWNGAAGCWRHPFLPCEEPADETLMRLLLKPTFPHHSHRGDCCL